MYKRNRSTLGRNFPSPLVLMIGAGFVVALVAVMWARKSPTKKKIATAKKTQKKVKKVVAAAKKKAPEVRSDGAMVFENTVKNSLPYTVRKKMGREKGKFLAAVVARILIWKLDLRRDLRRGDNLRVLYKPTNDKSKFEVLAMQYRSSKHGKTFDFYRFHENNRKYASYYDKEGNEVEVKLRNSPLRTYEQVTSILKMRPKHKGVDFKAPTGTKIYLPWNGRVIRPTWNFRYNGNCVEMEFRRRGRRVRGMFLHMDKVAAIVKRGKRLRAGTVIGTVGNTGRSTGPHLHYQLQTPGKRVLDPFKVHGTYTRKLSAGELGRFRTLQKQLEQQLLQKEHNG